MEGLVAAAGQAGTVSTEVCADEGEALYEIDRGRRARFVCRGRLSLGRDGLRCGDRRFPLRDIADLAMTGQRTLVFSAGGKSWELKNPRPRSAAKYQRAFDLLKRP
ncbi:MAG: hypothetical protein LBT11_03985 [Treponema sp.]|jgi:hypothetical protein|nr:hypothetical protein [Treponema sp.]